MAKKWCTWDESTPTKKPDGGFLPIHVSAICRLWSGRHTDIPHTRLGSLLMLRVFFAGLDMGAVGRSRFDPSEVCERIGVKPTGYNRAQVRRAAEALTRIGAVKKQNTALRSADVGSSPMLERIRKGRRRVPVPRRLVRRLAATSHEARMATMLGTFIRCLHANRDSLERAGRVQATWIADVFGISRSSAHRVLGELVEQGVIEQLETTDWSKRRWGVKTRVRLDRLAPSAHADPARRGPTQARADRTPARKKRAHFGRSCLNHHLSPYRERNKNHHPAPKSTRRSGVLRHPLNGIKANELDDLDALRGRFEANGGGSERDWITFVAYSRRALRVGASNAPGCFRVLAEKQLRHHINQEDEDAAVNWLKRRRWGVNVCRKPEPPEEHRSFEPAAKTPRSKLSADAKLAETAIALHDTGKTRLHPHTVLRAGGCPMPVDRWNRAVAELGRAELQRDLPAGVSDEAEARDPDGPAGSSPGQTASSVRCESRGPSVGKAVNSCRRADASRSRLGPGDPDGKIAAALIKLCDRPSEPRHPFDVWRGSRPGLTAERWNGVARGLGRPDLVVTQRQGGAGAAPEVVLDSRAREGDNAI